MAKRQPRSGPWGPGIPSKISLPLVIVSCLGFSYIGFLLGRSPGEKTASLKTHMGRTEANKLQKEEGENLVRPKQEAHLHAAGASGNKEQTDLQFQVLSWHPRALMFTGFAPKEICENIIKVASKNLAPSGLALRQGETEENTQDIRTSSGTFLTAANDPSGSLAWVEKRMAEATMIPVSHGEAFNVLRYNFNQKYNSHYDTFNPAEYGPQPSQRIASFLLYLSDVEEGGETMFPFEGYKNMDINYNYKDCIGLKIKPRQGDALLFYSVMNNGSFDPAALHGSCPVIKGEKWVATKWIRDKSIY